MRQAEAIDASDSLGIKTRTYYSILHLTTAIRFARKAQIIEQKYKGKFDSELTSELNSYVTSVVFSSVAFIEANINEIITDLFDGSHRWREIKIENLEHFKCSWDVLRQKENSFSAIEKHEIALSLLYNKRIPKGSSKVQNLVLLIKIRNLLIHYKPEWQEWTDSPKEERTVFKSLQNKFDLNPFFGKDEPFFPQKCLGYGFAKWGIDSALLFTNEFYEIMDCAPAYQHALKELNWVMNRKFKSQ